MTTPFTPVAWLGLTFQALAYYLVPVLLWVVLTRLLRVSWRFVGLGALTWLTAMPFLFIVPMVATALFGQGDAARIGVVWGIALSFAAGIFEETSRYFYYRRNATLRDPANRRHAIVAGAGHGGTEALVLGLQNVVMPLAMLFFAPQMIPAEMQQSMSDSNAVASYAFIGGLSRILLIFAHIGFTLMVWRAVTRKQPLWYLAAIVLHIVLDLIAFVWPAYTLIAVLIALVLAGWAVMATIQERQRLRAEAPVLAQGTV